MAIPGDLTAAAGAPASGSAGTATGASAGPSSPPSAEDGLALTVAAVARRLGVAPATLRTWDRRYGLGPSTRTAGSHRRYSGTDLARLEVMRRLTLQGVSPADAARAAIAASVTARPLATVSPLPRAFEPGSDGPADTAAGPGGADHPVTPEQWFAEDDQDGLAPSEAGHADAGSAPDRPRPSSRGSGGQVVSLPQADPLARGLARAALALDAPAAAEIVRGSVERRGVIWTWDELLVPVLAGVGRRWELTGAGVDVEHLLSEVVASSLQAVTARLRHAVNPRPVLLASAEDELHALPLHALAAALAERHVGTRVLGARVPRAALAAAVRRAGPAAVFVWSQLTDSGDPDQLTELPVQRPAALVMAGGPGWPEQLPVDVERAQDLTHAVTRITAAVGG